MAYSIINKFIKHKIIILLLSAMLLLQGCAWVTITVVAGGALAIAATGGAVSYIEKTDTAIAVERAIAAIEMEGGVVTDFSFMDGYVKGSVGKSSVSIHVYKLDDGQQDISVRASRFLISNSKLSRKILENYKNNR